MATDEVIWDYEPSGIDQITGKPFAGPAATLVMERGPERLGHVYKKALYREYTDETFSTLKARSPAWGNLGIVAPLLRAEVGDTIEVVFRNNMRHPASMYPHEIFYTKSSEGSPYVNGTTGADRADDAVEPGGTHRYVRPVPERAGPTRGEPSTSLWMYHSHTSETEDVDAEFIGPLIVTRRGEARPDGSPKDVDTEIVAAFLEIDENISSLFEDNIIAYAENPTTYPRIANLVEDRYVANLKETINSFSFGHTPPMRMHQGERVRWHVFSSTNFEIHAPHWHANTVVAMHMRTDVLNLLPMGMSVADMVPDNPGMWLFHCHVGPRLDASMIMRYEVLPAVAVGGGMRWESSTATLRSVQQNLSAPGRFLSLQDPAANVAWNPAVVAKLLASADERVIHADGLDHTTVALCQRRSRLRLNGLPFVPYHRAT